MSDISYSNDFYHSCRSVEQIPSHSMEEKKVFSETDKFIPRGAIAFFIALLALCAVIWFGIYFLMLSR